MNKSYKLFQLNTDMGRELEELKEYILKEDFDILNLQELGGTERTQNGIDTFKWLTENLPEYKGQMVKMFRVKNKPENYMGPGIFTKKNINVIKTHEIWMTEFWEIEEGNKTPTDRPYAALGVEIDIEGKNPLLLVSTQLTWVPRPFDTDTTIERSRKLYDFIKASGKEFVLTGDFNVDSRTITSMQFEELGRNLTRENKVTNTLNPRLHRAQHLFPQGIPSDQIIVSEGVIVKKFEVIEKDLSDHFGLVLKFEI